jgi:hypothetical protein
VLQETIDKAYKVFESYKPARPLDVCTDCCMTVEQEGKLANLPVREIPQDLLAAYNDSAKPVKTRIEEVKHFLPRYLDLIAQFKFPTHSTELSFSRLIPFDNSEWIDQEQQLIAQFSIDFFKHCLSTYPIPSFSDRIDTIIIMFWRAGFDINSLLTIWENEKTEESVLHFRDLYFHGFDQYNQAKLFSSFGDNELADKLRNWLDKDVVKKIF